MKQLVLTGLSTDQAFGKPEPQFFLVFNNGDLRVPVTEQAAQIVVGEMYGEENPTPSNDPQTFSESQGYETAPVVGYDDSSDDGVNQV